MKLYCERCSSPNNEELKPEHIEIFVMEIVNDNLYIEIEISCPSCNHPIEDHPIRVADLKTYRRS